MATEAAAVTINRVATRTIRVPIEGTSSLIVHRWSDKAKKQMLDAQQGRKAHREIRDPQRDYDESLYRLPDERYGFPTLAFKAATIGACRFYGKALPMTQARQFLFMTGELSADGVDLLTEIHGEPKMREDMVRVGMGGTDLRYRAEFVDWTAVLVVTFVTTALAEQSVLSLIDAGGLGVGVGEWRPEKRGQNGTYRIADGADIEAVTK
jgi:hypothetical protein